MDIFLVYLVFFFWNLVWDVRSGVEECIIVMLDVNKLCFVVFCEFFYDWKSDGWLYIVFSINVYFIYGGCGFFDY